jgi:protein involved in polysaccharide export with SLBB domain
MLFKVPMFSFRPTSCLFNCLLSFFGPGREMTIKFSIVGSIGLMLVLSACATEKAGPPIPHSSPASSAQHRADDSRIVESSALDQLWKNRMTKATDFPIGIGDVLEISIPAFQGADVQYLQSAESGHGDQAQSGETVRVDGLGDIALPLLRHIHAAGLTENELRTDIVNRLGKYMYDPEVRIFVQSYNSREVAVSGEVHSPGMYTVNGPAETIRDLIIRAGGATANAAPKVILTPAKESLLGTSSPASNHPLERHPTAADSNVKGTWEGADATSEIASSYVIDFAREKSAERFLSLPIRPGDTIYVPRAGSVTVTGWVYTPKSVDITPGLGVLGAVSAAGGPLFAADATRVKILRHAPEQSTETVMINLNDIKADRAPDVLVQANDIVDVPYSTVRIPGYALYYGVKGMVELAPAMLLVGGGL